MDKSLNIDEHWDKLKNLLKETADETIKKKEIKLETKTYNLIKIRSIMLYIENY
jgi:hypothetical protein